MGSNPVEAANGKYVYNRVMFKRKSVLLLLGINALFLLVILALVLPKLGGFTYPTIIHFDRWNGVDFLGSQSDIVGILLTTFAFIVINLFLAFKLFKKDAFLSYFFLSINILISVFLLMFSATVIGNN